MAEELKLHHPWLVAVWPGMGKVAISAGYYLMAKLGMYGVAEFEAADLFDPEHVVVDEGLISPGVKPRSRFYVWIDPERRHDLVVFIGEAQPPVGKYSFCTKLIEYTRELGVERVFTFAAMASGMHPTQPSRVFAAATDRDQLRDLERLDLSILKEGYISGLNGILLGVAAEYGLPGTCLLGEIPQLFSQLPFPKASLAVLEIFTRISKLEVDLGELAEDAHDMEQQLGELLAQVEETLGDQFPPPEAEWQVSESTEEENLDTADQERIERLFQEARSNRSKAYELKRELDRLDVFKEYEDRFLDLFKK